MIFLRLFHQVLTKIFSQQTLNLRLWFRRLHSQINHTLTKLSSPLTKTFHLWFLLVLRTYPSMFPTTPDHRLFLPILPMLKTPLQTISRLFYLPAPMSTHSSHLIPSIRILRFQRVPLTIFLLYSHPALKIYIIPSFRSPL